MEVECLWGYSLHTRCNLGDDQSCISKFDMETMGTIKTQILHSIIASHSSSQSKFGTASWHGCTFDNNSLTGILGSILVWWIGSEVQEKPEPTAQKKVEVDLHFQKSFAQYTSRWCTRTCYKY